MKSLTNRNVADALQRHGELLEIAGESAFRRRAFDRAAEAVRFLDEPVSGVAAEGRLREIPGIGAGIAAAITQLIEVGHFSAHDELTQHYPETLLELVAVPGVGAKTAQKLYTLLAVDSLERLEEVAASDAIANTKGLGTRVESTIRSGLAALRRRTGRLPLGAVLPLARAFAASLSALLPGDQVSLAGSARRWSATVGDLDFLIGTASAPDTVGAIQRLPMVDTITHMTESTWQVDFGGGVLGDVYLVHPSTWGSALVRATGNQAHLSRLRVVPEHASTEEEVYRANGLPWIPPELRVGNQEFERWFEIDSLVTTRDINGELHTHTTWSDGNASIHEMAIAAAARGYEFLGITDHSHGLGVAGGLDVARLAQQRHEISAETGTAGVRLLAGAEVEVHRDGSLDFDEETLARLDVVVASLHTGLRQPRDELTSRLIDVLQNENVDIIAHPSGRLIERREGGDFDWDRVFATAAKTGTALEINADPARLDLDPHLAEQANSHGCLITVNCDAHRPDGFEVMEYGVAMARRAWLTPRNILNCWPRETVLEWLASRR